jgi:hypothetical protein
MRRWQLAVLVVGLFCGSQNHTRAGSPALRTGDVFNCSTTSTMTTFTVTGDRSSEALGPTQFLLRILASELDETLLGRDVPEQVRKPQRYPISSREDGSVFSFYSNGSRASDRHAIALHLLNEKAAVFTDTAPGYRNAGGGVTIWADSGLCQKVRK